MPPKEVKAHFIEANGKLEPLTDITEVELSNLRECAYKNFVGNDGLEISFAIDKRKARMLCTALQIDQGSKVEIEVSDVCGTFLSAVQLAQELARFGATNIKLRSEKVENPDPKRRLFRFVATGIFWNTNNFRKMHGLPMKRRNKWLETK